MEMARRFRAVRVAALFAACLTSATAFGLHPEPGAGKSAPSKLGINLPASRLADSGSHDCLACRAHRPLVSVPILEILSAPRPSSPRVFVSRPSPLSEFEPGGPEGRAPSDLS
jgi:hypothetical protein